MQKNDFDVSRNLIVNYLPPTYSQDDVKTMFGSIGVVTNCKLIRNLENGQSLGYAFIEFPDAKLAAQAIEKLDGVKLDNKTLKVSYARQSSPEIKDSNVYVAGLPEWVSEEKLFSLFTPYGNIITHKLLVGPDNKSRGVGFVRYALKSEATNAIESMGGKMLPEASTALTVKLAIPPASKQQIMAAGGGGNTLTNTRQSNRFNPMAPSNQIALNTQPSYSNNPPAYSSSILGSTSSLLSNPYSVVQNRLDGQVHSIYVYGLQPTHTELTLYELFAPFGAILNVKLIRDLTKEEKPCKGFGFVNFRKYDDAYEAITRMHNCPFDGKNLQVSFKQNKPGLQASSIMQQGNNSSMMTGMTSTLPNSMVASALMHTMHPTM